MKRLRIVTLLALGLGLPLSAAEKTDPSWGRLKSLVGDWEGSYEGKPSHVSYKLVSNGTVLMETMEGPDASQMVTLYHPDGASLLMTHYCSMGNQPRMRSKGLQDGRLDFAFVDAANLRSPGEHRMTRLVLSFPGLDRLVQEWTSKEAGKEHVGRFECTRKK
jgi:hypothetical protein